MIIKLQQLLDEYNENEHRFTYAYYLESVDELALKTGLVGCFYLDKAYLPEKRHAIGQVLALYDKYWGDKLISSCFDGESNKLEHYSKNTLNQRNYIFDKNMDELYFYCSSVDQLEYVLGYLISAYSRADWYENVHDEISYVQFYLPITELSLFGIEKFVNFIKQISELLQPMHGFFGLGLQHSYEYSDYQHLEYELAYKFLGLDISNIESDLRFREGFKSINWLTILGNDLIQHKLGNLTTLEKNNHDKEIKFHPYSGGVLVRAGEVPELGDVQRNPYPEHYVNVNALLKLARVHEIASLGYGSVADEIRFNKATSQEWLARFDNPKPIKPQPIFKLVTD